MTYQFEFGDVFAYWPELVAGVAHTLVLSALAMAIGMVVAVLGALAKTSGPNWLRRILDAYIELIRNTPFLIQIFMIYFGLPAAGLRLSSDSAALLALVVNVGAYGIEIIRAGIESITKGQIEAGKSLGLKPLQIFRYVILKPSIQAIYPSLTSQFILLMLSSAVVSVISADDLTSVAANLQSQTFRSFEIYIVVTLIYLSLALAFSALFRLIQRRALSYPDRR
jgi:polar amino acid transport system permease protein